jgi:hypothetical protein
MAREREVPKQKFSIFWKRATQFRESMRENLASKRSMPCVSDAVMCSIACVDSLAVFRNGKKSSAQSHFEAVSILKEVKTSNDAERARLCVMLSELLKMKAVAQYEDQEPSMADAGGAARICEKIYGFVESELRAAGALP